MLIYHILGWLTMASSLGLGVGLIPVMWHTGREHRTWIRPMAIPEVSEVPLTLSSGADCVGLV